MASESKQNHVKEEVQSTVLPSRGRYAQFARAPMTKASISEEMTEVFTLPSPMPHELRPLITKSHLASGTKKPVSRARAAAANLNLLNKKDSFINYTHCNLTVSIIFKS